MVYMEGEVVYRDSRKVGYLEGTVFYDENGRKLGWYDKQSDEVFWADSDKAGYIDNGYIYYSSGKEFDSADYIYDKVGGYSALCAAASALLFGEDG